MARTPSSWVRFFQSPGYACNRTSSHSPSRKEEDSNEDWQEDHASADIIVVSSV